MLFTESLRKNHQFRLVYNKGKSVACHYLVLYALKNGTDKNRLGISVSKKVGKSVVRSHKTRLIRENYRLIEQNLLKGFDIVFIVRVNAKDSDYYEIKRAMEKLFRKIFLLRESNAEECNDSANTVL